MKVTVWGARGSIPVSGPEYVRYGGDTTCLQVDTEGGDVVILDAGSGLRALGNVLIQKNHDVFHFLLSHAHWDHLLGLPFFKPLYREGVTIHFHGCTFAQQSIRTILSRLMEPPFFPVKLDDVGARLVFDEECKPEFPVAGLWCRSIPLSHPNGGYGFRLLERDRSLAFFPDNELSHLHPGGKTFNEYVDFVFGTELLIHDAEYLPSEYDRFSRGWGHSVYLDTVRLAIAAEVDRLMLWHLNQDRSDDAVDEILESAVATAKVGSNVECLMARSGFTVEV